MQILGIEQKYIIIHIIDRNKKLLYHTFSASQALKFSYLYISTEEFKQNGGKMTWFMS